MLDSWPGTIQEETGQLDKAEKYKIMTGICKHKKVKEFNLKWVKIMAPELAPGR